MTRSRGNDSVCTWGHARNNEELAIYAIQQAITRWDSIGHKTRRIAKPARRTRYTTIAAQVDTYNETAGSSTVKGWSQTSQKTHEKRCIRVWTSHVTTWDFFLLLSSSVCCKISSLRRRRAHTTEALALTAAPRAPVGEPLKPERRWCHGPDVKKARWPLARLLFPPCTITRTSERAEDVPTRTTTIYSGKLLISTRRRNVKSRGKVWRHTLAAKRLYCTTWAPYLFFFVCFRLYHSWS